MKKILFTLLIVPFGMFYVLMMRLSPDDMKDFSVEVAGFFKKGKQ